MTSLSPLEHTAIGALAGLTEVTLMQPTVAIKNALQEGRPVPLSPTLLYRGYVINAGAMLPITATQFGMNRFLDGLWRQSTGDAPGDGGRVVVAMGAGTASAFFGCPAEFVMIQQQKSGRSLFSEFKSIVSTYGAAKMYKGITVTMARESLYAAGYLGVLPLLRTYLEGIPAVNNLPGGPLVASGIAAGLLATVTTHPADTIKTRMQAFPNAAINPEYRTVSTTIKHIMQTEGPGTFFAGLLPRAARIVCAVFILTGTRNTIVEAVEEKRKGVAVVGV